MSVLFIALIVVVILTLMMMNGGGGKKWTVYGSMKCGWTRKQLDHMKSVGIPYVYVDCDKEGCDNITAFPTTIDSNGVKTVGFKYHGRPGEK